MQATIADIRRGDRFTRLSGRGGTFIALRAARPFSGGTKVRVPVVEDQGDQIGADGIVELGAAPVRRSRIIDPASDTPVEIHDRNLPIHHGSDDPLPFTDTPNPHLGGMTDREAAAGQLRQEIPAVVEEIEDLGSERDVLIRKGFAAGISAIELAELSGLSRARVYQIRDNRR